MVNTLDLLSKDSGYVPAEGIPIDNHGQVGCSHAPLSPIGIIWYLYKVGSKWHVLYIRVWC